MKKLILLSVLILLMASPAFAGFVSVFEPVTYPSANSGAEIVSQILSNVEGPTWEDTGGGSDAAQQIASYEIKEQLNLVTFSSYRNVGDMPITRAILGTAGFNLHFWPEVTEALKDKVPNADFVSAYNKSKELEKDVIPRAAAVTAHAQNLLPGVIYPISIKILSLLFVIQLLSTFLSSRTGTSQFFVDTARFMFFLIMILTFRIWVMLVLDVFNFCGYMISPWGGQEEMQKELVAAARSGGLISVLKPSELIYGIMRWVAYASIRVLLISRDVLMGVSLVIGPICFVMGYLSLYSQNDFIKGFLAGWMQAFFKFQFWGVFASVTMIGLSIVSFLTNMNATDPLTLFITGIAFVHVAYNIPKISENMSAVVISSVIMATVSMAATRGTGQGVSAAGSAVKSGIRKVLGR